MLPGVAGRWHYPDLHSLLYRALWIIRPCRRRSQYIQLETVRVRRCQVCFPDRSYVERLRKKGRLSPPLNLLARLVLYATSTLKGVVTSTFGR